MFQRIYTELPDRYGDKDNQGFALYAAVSRNLQLGKLHEEGKKLDQLDYLRDLLQKQLPADAKNNL